jgi:hypothetical protein
MFGNHLTDNTAVPAVFRAFHYLQDLLSSFRRNEHQDFTLENDDLKTSLKSLWVKMKTK